MALCVASLLEELVFEVFVRALHPVHQAVSPVPGTAKIPRTDGYGSTNLADLPDAWTRPGSDL
jgi:hypothetical protein